MKTYCWNHNFARGVQRAGVALGLIGVLLVVLPVGQTAAQSKSSDEAQVRAAVEAEIEAQELKINKLEAELELAKSKLKARRAKLETIVANRIKSQSKPVAPDAKTADEIGKQAWQLWGERKLNEALPLFEKAVAMNPKDPNLWNGLGWTKCNMGSHKSAREAFRKAVELQPDHLAARNGIGQSSIALGDLDLAEKELLSVTNEFIEKEGEKAATSAASWYGLVQVYILKKEKDKAIQWAERLLKHSPDEPNMKELLTAAKKL